MPDTMRQNSEEASSLQNKYTNGSLHKRAVSGTNGHVQSNGNQTNGSNSSISPTFHGHSREEVARLLIQGLQDLGYNDSADTLIRESGYELEDPMVAAFRQSVLNGEWSEAETILFGSRGKSNGSLSNGHSYHEGFTLAEGVDENDLRFQLRRQKYLELLESRDHAGALMVLRQELTPLHRDTGQLHNLSGLMVCPTAEDLRQQSVWDGAHGSSRRNLLTQLSKAISASVMIPNHRLATLLSQVKKTQVAKCYYHNPRSKLSLFTDHVCDRDQYPLRTTYELSLKDEVWSVAFSHNGTRLAATGQMSEISVYETSNFKLALTLKGHAGFVALVVWSPDDSKLVSCSDDKTAKIWCTITGDLLHTINSHDQPVSSASWSPDGQFLVTGSLDWRNSLYQWSENADFVHTWSAAYRVNAIAISPDGQRMVVLSSDCNIHVYNFQTREEEYSMKLKQNLTCVTISRDSNYMLVNMADDELQLININTAEIVERYLGQKQSRFSIRSTFGGSTDDTLVMTGSEDSNIYIFNKDRGTLIEKLVGHTASVNSIAWNPAHACMFASAGDDHKVRIWTKPITGSSGRSHPTPIPSPDRPYNSYSTLL